MDGKTAVILAAGAGTRMKSDRPKVLHEVMGRSMVSHVISQVRRAGADSITAVIGHGADVVRKALSGENVTFAVQEEQLGTGHAVMQALDRIPGTGDVFILCGDTPLITAETLTAFAEYHAAQEAVLTVLTAEYEDPTGYGRILRDPDGGLQCIVEQKDASEEEKLVREVNAGMYCVDAAFLRETLPKISNENAQHEYYLTDLVELAVSAGQKTAAFCVDDPEEIMGVNNRVQLAAAAKVMQRRINRGHMMNGVTILDPERTYIEDGVRIGRDTEIWPGTVLRGDTEIGSGVMIGTDCILENAVIADGADVQKSVILDSSVGKDSSVGPFAYIRPGTSIGQDCKVGDFVEFKNADFGDGSKASHLAYIGDADVGTDCNIGCGVIFANYDGKNKHRTVVGDRVFVGSNSNLVAPVTVHDDAFIAAGTTVTKEAPSGSLIVGRSPDKSLEGWVERKGLIRSNLHGKKTGTEPEEHE